MASLTTDETPNISALRCKGEIVLQASTSTWKETCGAIANLCVARASELCIPLRDDGVSGQNLFPEITTLVFRLGQAPLHQYLSEDRLVIEGSADDLLALAENIDFPNPFEGAHHHSDSWMPDVSPESISLVFMHGS